MKILTTLVCILALLCTSAAVFAQDDEARHSYFTDRLQISAGVFLPNFNTDVKLDGDNLAGTTVDFEKLLGLDDQIVTPFINLMWRINDKHRLDFMYYNLDRDGTLALNNNINFGDETFSVGTEMESSLDMSIYRLGYDYSFVNDGRLEFGVGISTDIIPADFSVKAQGGTSESESAVLFVPTFGVHAAIGVTDKLVVRGKIQGLVYDVDNQDGDVINGILGFEYDAFKHFSLGLAYAYYDFDVDLDTSGFKGSIAFVYRGPLVYGKIHF
ncbi:MAG: hypothetical protein FJZ11_04805 [Candidatus Omnitrophica bacterium]|nr:hypothetical protein [Candidatus Omnitrophota bacterium]